MKLLGNKEWKENGYRFIVLHVVQPHGSCKSGDVHSIDGRLKPIHIGDTFGKNGIAYGSVVKVIVAMNRSLIGTALKIEERVKGQMKKAQSTMHNALLCRMSHMVFTLVKKESTPCTAFSASWRAVANDMRVRKKVTRFLGCRYEILTCRQRPSA